MAGHDHKAAGMASPLAQPATRHEVSRRAWLVLLVLAVVNSVNYMDRWVMSVLIQPIKEDMHLSDTQLGLLTGLAFSLSYALFALPIARWADNGVRRNVLICSISFWSLMTGLGGLAQNFWQLFLARIGVGAGESGCIPTGQSIISDYFPNDRRAFALAVFSAGSMIGKVAGIGGAGFLVVYYGWHGTLLLLAVPGLVAAVAVRLLVPEPPRGRFDNLQGKAGTLSTGEALRSLLTTRSYVLMSVAGALSNLVIFGVQNWTPSFYMRHHGMTAAQVGAAVATVVGVCSAVGLLSGGYVTQMLMRRDERWSMWLAAIVHIVVGGGMILVFTTTNLSLSLGLFAAMSVTANIPVGALFATKMNVADPRCRALASALALALTSVVGLGLGPLLVGSLSDFFQAIKGDDALRYALMTVASLNIVPALLYLFSTKTLLADIARASHRPA